GTQKVYDIGLAREHNFILANGCVASNCFNKSHSTAYAYVTYQTAYLKANYPVEYMAALLSESSSNSDKVKNYIDTCQRMGIDVQPPNINRSQVDFTPVGDTILFGLSAVRSVGEGAIESILKAREEAGGEFKSLADLCERVDLRAVRRNVLETLIGCGAFDSINSNRRQLLEDIELVISWAQNRAKEREVGQTNLFDLAADSASTSGNSGFESAPSAPPVEDFSLPEKLQKEKELLGFFVSEHPLSYLNSARQILSPVQVIELANQPKRTLISMVVMLSGVKEIATKKGDRMAFLQMEDATGATEGVVFPKSYERIQAHLHPDARLIVWGKAETKDDKVQLIVEDVEPIETVQMVMVELTPEQARSGADTLRGILRGQAGDKNAPKIPVLGIISAEGQREVIRFGQQYWVQNQNRQAAIAALQKAHFNAREDYILPQQS
ncbi:MAG: OB-fold nucleic acid binding domain-containing protein, partial [Cyanobacteriota bacterium]|nr:OB-fold nucleic acid binding domain-containing protein [Cyanobacteriota bacterium]